jgi:glycerophosphoryl diester phosphodiesterase
LIDPPLVYAHRGGAALRPENTIEAFDHGLSLGADGLEFDIHFARDGVIVVHHDETLERTTNARGRLAEFTADELARLDAGYTFRGARPQEAAEDGEYPFRGRGIRIPSLREVLRRYDVPVIIEMKVNDPELARSAIDEIRAAGAVDRVALGAFERRVLKAVREYEPRIRTGAGREETRWALYSSWIGLPLRRPRYCEFQVPERFGATTIVTPRFIARAHRAGVPVKVWTVDDAADIRRLLEWGADAIISDRPDVAVNEVKRRRDPSTAAASPPS